MAAKDECDLVMKGGVTSGTVYPKAIRALAERYRFRGIGGTSAGAIAAAGAAAAEYWRQCHPGEEEMKGFRLLDKLPQQLAERLNGGSRLLSLFTPQPQNEALFGLLLSLIGNDRDDTGAAKSSSRGSVWSKLGLTAIRRFRFAALVGAAVAVALAWGLGADFSWSWRLLVAIALIAAGALAGALAGAVLAVLRLPGNNFGLCLGMGPRKDGVVHLTDWLYELFQSVAGKPADQPLTFGELRTCQVDLSAVTTNLSFGHPQRLPFRRGEPWAFYDPGEWSKYFPAEVMRHLLEHPRVRRHADGNPDQRFAALADELETRHGLRPLPGEDDLPVVVAVRMSLSFPVLLSAVPLHLVDPAEGGKPGAQPRRCWFSDGGISSNFPLHFFDSALPTRPTFAIDLQNARGDRAFAPVELPATNTDGMAQRWSAIGNSPDGGSLAHFFLAMFNVMQNWRDNSLKRLPGYRDRVATVNLRSHEGGLNLNMPAPLITELANRGEEAANLLALHFGQPKPPGVATTWENHCWVRSLTLLAGLERLLDEIDHAWAAAVQGGVNYGAALDPRQTPGAPSYGTFTPAQRIKAQGYIDGLRAVLAQVRAGAPGVPDMHLNGPHPVMHLRLTAES